MAGVSVNQGGNPVHVKFSPIRGLTSKAVGLWAKRSLGMGCAGLFDGLACIRSVVEAGCEHPVIVSRERHPKRSPGIPMDQYSYGQPKDQHQQYISRL